MDAPNTSRNIAAVFTPADADPLVLREHELNQREAAIAAREQALEEIMPSEPTTTKKNKKAAAEAAELTESHQNALDAGIVHGPVVQYTHVDPKTNEVLVLNAQHQKSGNPVLVCDRDHDIAKTCAKHGLVVGPPIEIDDVHVGYVIDPTKSAKPRVQPS